MDNPNSTFHKKSNFFIPSVLEVFHVRPGPFPTFPHLALGPGRLTESDSSNRLPHPPASRGDWPMGHWQEMGCSGPWSHRGLPGCCPHPGTQLLSGALSVSGFCFPQLFRLQGRKTAPLSPLPGAPLTLLHICKESLCYTVFTLP